MTDRRRALDDAIAIFQENHRHDDGMRAVGSVYGGARPDDVAEELGLPITQVFMWLGEVTWLTLGFPRELAQLRACSEHTAPRTPATTRLFEDVVRDVYVPRLKSASFRKQRYRWTRTRSGRVQVIDIQRGWSTGDLLRFTSNIEESSAPDADATRRRIGEFIGEHDYWWSIQLGHLARDFPVVVDDASACRKEIAGGLDGAIQWLDRE